MLINRVISNSRFHCIYCLYCGDLRLKVTLCIFLKWLAIALYPHILLFLWCFPLCYRPTTWQSFFLIGHGVFLLQPVIIHRWGVRSLLGFLCEEFKASVSPCWGFCGGLSWPDRMLYFMFLSWMIAVLITLLVGNHSLWLLFVSPVQYISVSSFL